jgi:hypothetical protein
MFKTMFETSSSCACCTPLIVSICLSRAFLHVVVFHLCLCLCFQSWRHAAFESTFSPVIVDVDGTHVPPYSIHCTPYPVSSFMPSIPSCAVHLQYLTSGTVVCRPAFASLDSWIDMYPILFTAMVYFGGMHCGVVSEERFEDGAPIDESRVIHYSRDGDAARLPPIISWSGWWQLFQNKSVVNYEPLRIFGRHLLIQPPHPNNMPSSWTPELYESVKHQHGQLHAWLSDTAIPLSRSLQSHVDGSLDPCRKESREVEKMLDSSRDKPWLHPYVHSLVFRHLRHCDPIRDQAIRVIGETFRIIHHDPKLKEASVDPRRKGRQSVIQHRFDSFVGERQSYGLFDESCQTLASELACGLKTARGWKIAGARLSFILPSIGLTIIATVPPPEHYAMGVLWETCHIGYGLSAGQAILAVSASLAQSRHGVFYDSGAISSGIACLLYLLVVVLGGCCLRRRLPLLVGLTCLMLACIVWLIIQSMNA